MWVFCGLIAQNPKTTKLIQKDEKVQNIENKKMQNMQNIMTNNSTKDFNICT
jgi:hypothetical protein